MNKVCYTALFGAYEELKEPSVKSEGWDFYCFTDQDITSETWKIIKVIPDIENQRMARKIKLLPHVYLPDYEYTFWLDAAFQINIDLNTFWNKYFKSFFCCPSHPIRNCVYREVESCIANKRGDEGEIRRQGAHYKSLNIPAFEGIITSGVLMRQKTDKCIALCNDWWDELSQHSTRDQIAFAKASRKHIFHNFIWDYSQSKELKYIKHFKYRH